MTDHQIAADVDRGLAIHRQIAELKSELKTIESRLHTAALEGVTAPLEDPDREGRQFLAVGRTATLPVVIESDQVVSSIVPGGPVHGALDDLCGGGVRLLFRDERKLVRIAKDGKAYRAALREHFPADLAPRILAATLQRDKHGVPKSRIIIPWDRAVSAAH